MFFYLQYQSPLKPGIIKNKKKKKKKREKTQTNKISDLKNLHQAKNWNKKNIAP